ncbi:MAG: hypothetical protein ABSA65_11390 [Acidimicrobiales bacterium]|jgi:uncharacterized lipoprotein YehR (DUF1307 family)
MRLRRKIVTIVVSVTCSFALAACGQQVVAHLTAAQSVRAAFTSAFDSPTTQITVTAQGLPGQASIADNSVSVVLTTSRENGSTSIDDQAVDISIDYQSAYLVDMRSVNGAEYFRLNLKYIEGLAGPTAMASASRTLDQLAQRPGFEFIHDVLLGNWVGVSTSTLAAFGHQLSPQLPSAYSSISGLQKASGISSSVVSSWMQSVRTWLSVHQTKTGEYSASLPIRSFAGSILQSLAKPLSTYSSEPFLSPSQLSKTIDEIPADLSLHANVWVSDGSVSKLQILIPNSTGSIVLAISHPAASVQVPAAATMLTEGDLTTIFGTVSGPLSKALGSKGSGLLSTL